MEINELGKKEKKSIKIYIIGFTGRYIFHYILFKEVLKPSLNFLFLIQTFMYSNLRVSELDKS